ncbi:hypothetical protein PISMIDRAFT_672588 [Pisolithus microcarpus 441]|uniref:Uncharacterized protein n=1 Tax=Pisolithus microcarpus 441 TaxID=765257 RepID=A0A0C9ZT37_9AGAM|nr:hypothetical protein PISMIDRAFT_672588 [Pisolithus microcarpus 441]
MLPCFKDRLMPSRRLSLTVSSRVGDWLTKSSEILPKLKPPTVSLGNNPVCDKWFGSARPCADCGIFSRMLVSQSCAILTFSSRCFYPIGSSIVKLKVSRNLSQEQTRVRLQWGGSVNPNPKADVHFREGYQ